MRGILQSKYLWVNALRVLLWYIPQGICERTDKLLAYLNALTPSDRDAFAARRRSTVGYLRKACSTKQQLSEGLCMRLAGESQGALRPEDLRPDLDWDYLRCWVWDGAPSW